VDEVRSTFTALGLITLSALALIVAPILWAAPRCTGSRPADRCPMAGGAKAGGFNTSVYSYRGPK